MVPPKYAAALDPPIEGGAQTIWSRMPEVAALCQKIARV
jgi:hypothetical protein